MVVSGHHPRSKSLQSEARVSAGRVPPRGVGAGRGAREAHGEREGMAEAPAQRRTKTPSRGVLRLPALRAGRGDA